MNIRWLNILALPWDAEHSTAGGLGDEAACTFFSFIRRNYVFQSSVFMEPPVIPEYMILQPSLLFRVGGLIYHARVFH